MSARSGLAGSLVVGSTALTSAVSLLSIVTKVAPALDSVKLIEEAVEVYSTHVRLPLSEKLPHWAVSGTAADLVVLWIGIFAAVNVYSYRTQGLTVWGHIKRNFCYLRSQALLPQLACTLPKYLVSFLIAPLVCCVFLIWSMRREATTHSLGYLTLNPNEVAHYILMIAATAAGILIVCGAAAKFLVTS